MPQRERMSGYDQVGPPRPDAYANRLRDMIAADSPPATISPPTTGGQDTGGYMGTPYGGTQIGLNQGIVNPYGNAAGQQWNELDDPNYQQTGPDPTVLIQLLNLLLGKRVGG